jgi:hypothetical protein
MSLSRQQITLLGIFALFIGPLLLVMLMRSSWWQYQPAGLKNHGTLIQPPAPLALVQAEKFSGKWAILHVIDQPCDEACIEYVTALRQIHRATGRKADHLAIVLLSQAPLDETLKSRLQTIYPQFEYSVDSTGEVFNTLNSVNTSVESGEVRSYVLDPMLNVVLAYRSDANPGDMHKDLKRLLKWSDQENK